MLSILHLWEVSPETAHPRARALLGDDSIVWSYTSADSPIGNQIGADTFDSFIKFRSAQPSAPVRQVLADELELMEIPDDGWDLLDPEGLLDAIDAGGGSSLLLRDTVVLGLAFAQLIVEGTIDTDVRRLALLATLRQATDVVLSLRVEDSSEAKKWKAKLAHFRSVLERV